jgi:IPT/TIG domain
MNVVWNGATNAPITVSLTGLPQGVSASPVGSISLPAGSTSATVGLTAASAATLGSATITATATAQTTTTIQHQYKLTLTVSAPQIPLPTPARTSYILTGETPESIVYDRAHKVLYACVPSLDQVLIIDSTTHQTLKTLPVPAAGQSDLSPDGSQIVVGSDTVAELTFISTSSQTITRVAPFTVAEANAGSLFSPSLSGPVFNPVFLAGGDVLFLTGSIQSDPPNEGPLYRWSASTGTIAKSKAQPTAPTAGPPTALSRTPDGSKVLVITSQYEMAVYDAATDSFTATNSAFASFAGADPANPRFAAMDSNGFEILDTSLHQLASLPISTTTPSMPYALKFSLDGTELFVAQSGMFSGLFAYRAVNAVNYTMGSQAPLMSFYGDDEVSNDVYSEVPLAIDETNLIYGEGNRGIAIDDPLNYYTSSTPAEGSGFEFFIPDHGPVGIPTTTEPHNSYATNTGVYFFGQSGVAVPAGTVGTLNTNGYSVITTPPINTAGPASIEMVEPDNSFSFYPAAFTYGVQATGMAPSAGPASGGITAYVTAYGVGGGASGVTVTVGGVAAKVTGIVAVGGIIPNPLPYYDVAFTVPPGNAGTKADVIVTASGYSSTLTKAFTYEQQISNCPYPGGIVPNGLVYDPHRRYVYLLTNTQVDVFSLGSNSFLAPIIPPMLNGKMKLTGLDISVDGSLLAIANLTDQSVALVNPDNPSNSPKLVPLAINLFGSSYPGGPYSVAATSNGTFFVGTSIPAISGGTGSLYELNPNTGATQQRSNVAFYLNTAGFRLLRSADGTSILVASPNGSGGPLSLWNSSTNSFSSVDTPGFVDDGAISADGTTISCLDDVMGGGSYEFILDPSFDTLNNVVGQEGLGMGLLYGQFLNSSGALLYIPGSNGIDVYDVHKGTRQREIGVVESDIINIAQAATIDDTGTYLFLLTDSGLDVIEDAPPLSVRSASPVPNTAPAGTVITLRGAGFEPGATVTIGGRTVPAIVTDAQTLSFTLPSVVSDLAFTVSNPDGSSYTY